MQLILEAETSNIGMKDKMSILEQEPLGEKLMTNGNTIETLGGDVPKINKENILVKENTIDNCKGSASLNNDKQDVAQKISVRLTAIDDVSAVPNNPTTENYISHIAHIAEENKDKNNITGNGKAIEESLSNIVPETEVNTAHQEPVLIKAEKENETENIDINEAKVNDSDIKKKQDDNLEEEMQHIPKEVVNKNLDQQVDIKNEIKEIAKIEHKVNNVVQETISGVYNNTIDNTSQTDKVCISDTVGNSENDSNLRDNVSEPEVISVNTEPLKNRFLPIALKISNSVENISEIEVNFVNTESIEDNKNADENSSLTIAEKYSDSEEMISEPQVDSVNTECLEVIKNADDNCFSTCDQTEMESIEDIQLKNAVEAPSEITKSLLDYNDQTFEGDQDTLSSNDAAEKVPNEINNDFQMPMECDEPEIVTSKGDEKAETLIAYEKTEMSMDCDTAESSINGDKTQTSIHCDKEESSINGNKAESSIDCDKAETSISCDMAITSIDCEQAVTSISCDKAEASIDCDKAMTSINCDKAESSISCDKAEASIDCDKAMTSINCDKAESSINCNKAVTSMDCDKELSSIRCDKADKSIECHKADSSINYDKAETSMDCDKVLTSINYDKEETSISCGKTLTSTDCDNAEISINCDKADTSMDCDKEDTSTNCNKEETSIDCDKSESSMDCDKTETPMDCNKPIDGTTTDVVFSGQQSAECNEMYTSAKVEGITKAVKCDNETDTIISERVNVDDRVSDEDTVCKISNEDADASESNNVIPDVTHTDVTGKASCPNKIDVLDTPVTDSIDEILDVDEIKVISDKKEDEEPVNKTEVPVQQEKDVEKNRSSAICRLSNTLNILSDDEDEPTFEKKECPSNRTEPSDRQCINIEDDDDIMLIDEDTPSKEDEAGTAIAADEVKADNKPKSENSTIKSNDAKESEIPMDSVTINETELKVPKDDFPETITKPEINEKIPETIVDNLQKPKPLLAENLFKSYKKKFADMTRDDLEEFCVLKIVESVIDRSNLTEIRSKIKNMAQNIEQYKKKADLLTKQNRDLQVVLKSVQEEQKKAGDSPIMPLKITRSVGMQVLMTDKNPRKKVIGTGINAAANNNANNRQTRNTVNQSPRQQPQHNNSQPIPVPRLVPATATNNTIINKSNTGLQVNSPKKTGKSSGPQNGIRTSQTTSKSAEKRSHKMLTVDLTDDEPPAKVPAKATPAPVRLVNPQNLMAPRQPIPMPSNQPRKVYIPIGGPQGQSVRPGQTIMLKSVPPPGPRQRAPMAPMVRIPQSAVRMSRVQGGRHPAPLPEPMKQYQPPNWKALPPAPDLKLSKVENGIVISWKIDGYEEDSYEEIASFQLYAYQETSSPPNTNLWKKIGDVKALPLPMACTLTQFMAGYKYYFAVRAVDVRSRLGPFSLPGSILLLNKM